MEPSPAHQDIISILNYATFIGKCTCASWDSINVRLGRRRRSEMSRNQFNFIIYLWVRFRYFNPTSLRCAPICSIVFTLKIENHDCRKTYSYGLMNCNISNWQLMHSNVCGQNKHQLSVDLVSAFAVEICLMLELLRCCLLRETTIPVGISSFIFTFRRIAINQIQTPSVSQFGRVSFYAQCHLLYRSSRENLARGCGKTFPRNLPHTKRPRISDRQWRWNEPNRLYFFAFRT